MEKITFVNNQAPALNAANLNQIQTNVENAITEVENELPEDIIANEGAVKCGYKINGYDVYTKILTFTDSLSSNVLFTKTHGITGYNRIWIDPSNTCFTASTISYPFPMVGYNGNLTDKTYCYINGDNICIYSNGGWGNAWTKQIAIKYY